MTQGDWATADQDLLLGAGPALEPGFAAAGLQEGIEGFEAKQSDRRIECGCPACPAGRRP